ncbi:hypothetical protein llap_22744 [Limosa lapponica baueri]|uniref:Uncharacterized protein n=1 Tax=Limosa lapponica baueri TaxID=1758121 RepID=A0A2I0SZK3_LIMLA|nr:hypothetical protein llap_22744 [Limosa lapponica baueri]
MLSTVLNIIIFEDCRNQWSMSRPLLGLILLNEKYFSDLRNSIVNSQPPEKQQAMHLCFENLMEGIERNLLTKNRDRSVWVGDPFVGLSLVPGALGACLGALGAVSGH